MRRHGRWRGAWISLIAAVAAGTALGAFGAAQAANGSVTYTYDALGRISSVSYDTGVIILYTYDANGNRLTQVINVNTQPLCLGTSAHGNPTTWGAGKWSNAGAGC